MSHVIRTSSALATIGVALALVLTGCSASGTAPVGVATKTTTAAPASAPPSASASPSSAPSTSPATSGATSGSGSSGSTSGGGAASGSGSRCQTSSLQGSIAPGSGGAAGSFWVHLALRNTGSTTCTLQGWPGVSFVGSSNGTQIGNAAAEDPSSPHPTVSLAPGATAVAPLRIADTQVYPAGECDPTSPDGLRVYPPGSRTSLFVPYTDYAACRSTKVTELQVQALVPEGQAAD